MKRSRRLAAEIFLFAAGIGLSLGSHADFELAAPDGRRLLLMDNGTWRYLEAEDKEQANDKANEGKLDVRLERKVEHGSNCGFAVQFTNNLPYEVRSLVLYYSAYRANGVIYDTVSSGSGLMKPGNTQTREVEFTGIPCQDIVRVQVGGGDRCEVGELNKFNDKKGECLMLVRVMPSELVRFEK